jgi:hypothetical protein
MERIKIKLNKIIETDCVVRDWGKNILIQTMHFMSLRRPEIRGYQSLLARRSDI